MERLYGNYSSLINETNFTLVKKHVGSTEGGVLSGHGPLDTSLARFLVQAVIIIGLSRFLHIFLHKLRQPRVIAEIIGGICLGPSVLGNIPGFTQSIFPQESLGFLSTVSNIGLVFYLFLVGLELEPQAFFNHIRRSVAISLAGIILPFVLGVACSWGLYIYLLIPNVNHIPFPSFLLFTGVAMSITAFPVLARILTEKKLLNTPVGLVAISAAAIDDAVAWTLLALVISILNAGDNMTALYVFLLALGYALILLVIFRPLLSRLFNRFLAKSSNPVSQFLVAAVFICIFTSAWITELIGVHAIFGAFLFGLIIPRSHNMAIRLTEKIEDVIIIGFLPLFFASSGLKTNIGLLNDGMLWGWLLVVVVVACFGKLFGCTITARLTGIPWREACSVGVLMNTKGLVELIVLNIGYDAKVINDRIFLILVIMALVTTFMTSPIIAYIYPPKYHVNLTQKRTKVLSVVLPSGAEMASKKTAYAEEQIRLLVCVDELYPIPTIAKLLWLFKIEGNDEDFIINTLKIVETSERSSSIMIASQIVEAIKHDPGLNMMSLFGSLINVPTRNFMSLSPVNEVSEEVHYIANSEECNLIILPWFGQTVFGSILSSSPQEKIKSIITSATATTAVYVPEQSSNTIGTTTNPVPKTILVPFFGGADDREAVKIALRFYRHGGVKVTIIKVEYVSSGTLTHRRKKSKISLTSMNGHLMSNELHVMPQLVEDVALIDEVQKAAAESKDHSLSFKSIESSDLLTTVIDECKITRFDLVVVGRNYDITRGGGQSASFQNLGVIVDEMNGNAIPAENGHANGRPILMRSQSEKMDSFVNSSTQRSLSVAEDTSADEIQPSKHSRPTIVTEILGKLGQTLYESETASVLVVHRNNFIHL